MNAMPIDFALVADSFPIMLRGLLTTILLTAIALALGLPLSIPITLARMSKNRLVSGLAGGFVVFFRGAPLLILLYLVYYGLAQIKGVRDGPFWPILGSAFGCAVIGITLNHVAYMVEIVRGSLGAVPAGLMEASAALGLTPREAFTWIRLPLATRYGLKAYQNEVVMLTKGTAVVSVITVVDLTAVANEVFERTYDPFTPILMAAAFYWVFVNLIRLGFRLLDRYLNRHLVADDTSRTSARPVPEMAAIAGRRVMSVDAASIPTVPPARVHLSLPVFRGRRAS
jgi:arginine/ornithine transport system permease protein